METGLGAEPGTEADAQGAHDSRPAPDYDPAALRRILEQTRAIAIAGASTNALRPSWIVTRYLITRGYRVTPVNPRAAGQLIHGRTVAASFAEIPAEEDPIQMVVVFRRSDAAEAVVEEAIEALGSRGLETIWMQIGVINHAAAARAEAAGLRVVMDRCPKIELSRFNGELSMGGFNSGVISARRPAAPSPFAGFPANPSRSSDS